MFFPNMALRTPMTSALVSESGCCSILFDSSSVTVTRRTFAPGYSLSNCYKLTINNCIMKLSITTNRDYKYIKEAFNHTEYYLPDCVVTTLFMGIQKELSAIASGPEFVRKLEEYFGIDSHIKLVDSKDLPWLCDDKCRVSFNRFPS